MTGLVTARNRCEPVHIGLVRSFWESENRRTSYGYGLWPLGSKNRTGPDFQTLYSPLSCVGVLPLHLQNLVSDFLHLHWPNWCSPSFLDLINHVSRRPKALRPLRASLGWPRKSLPLLWIDPRKSGEVPRKIQQLSRRSRLEMCHPVSVCVRGPIPSRHGKFFVFTISARLEGYWPFDKVTLGSIGCGAGSAPSKLNCTGIGCGE